MGAHETADAVLTRNEADRLRNRALELVAQYKSHDAAVRNDPEGVFMDRDAWLAWEGTASVILEELARG